MLNFVELSNHFKYFLSRYLIKLDRCEPLNFSLHTFDNVVVKKFSCDLKLPNLVSQRIFNACLINLKEFNLKTITVNF